VTETNIHFPTESSLLDDAARVLSRLLVEARQVVQPKQPAQKSLFRDRHRQARRLTREIGQLARTHAKKGAKTLEKPSVRLYAQLMRLVETLVEQVEQVQPVLAGKKSLEAAGLHLVRDLLAFGPASRDTNSPTGVGRPPSARGR
jgi:IS5 family transposase